MGHTGIGRADVLATPTRTLVCAADSMSAGNNNEAKDGVEL